MKLALIRYLQCPTCSGMLNARAAASESDGEIMQGDLRCVGCAASWPIDGGVPRFVPTEAYAASFGYQWRHFARTQLDSATSMESRLTFVRATGIRPESLQGQLVLDAGCGMGRYSEVCASSGAEVIAVDLSRAVEAAFENVGRRPNVHIIQADIFALPLRLAVFDLAFSIGVLHHTPDTRSAFQAVAKHVALEGRLAVWVYSGEWRHRIYLAPSDVWRRLTSRVDRGWLLRLCRLAVPLYYLHRIPVLGLVTRWLFFTSMHPRPEWRVLDTFDWYSPRFHHRHTLAELKAWFEEFRFSSIRVNAIPVSATGVRRDA